MPGTISLGLRISFIESRLLASYAGTTYPNINPKAVLIGAWTGTTLGGVTGGLLAHKRPISPARVSRIESTAIWTGVLSTMGHHSITSGDTGNEILLTTSVGVLGGAALGAVIEHDSTLTESRVRYLGLGAFAGALVTGGLYASFAPSNAPAFLTHGIIATGIASGWYTAYTLTDPGELSASTPSTLNVRLVALPTHDGGVNVGTWGQF